MDNLHASSEKRQRQAYFRNLEIANAFESFLQNQATGGVLLLICTLAAVFLASFPRTEWFDNMWGTAAGITIGNFSIEMSLRSWINDALMAVFFFVVGLEIKREMLVGQLSSIKRSALPVLAAIGGMIVPAIIYSIFNAGNPESANGWGIPMATDIAFAIGILSLLGDRVPGGLKIFLTALAIVDDLGAIIVLAIFYPTHALHLDYLGYVAIIMAILALMNRARVKNKYFYLIPGIFMWYLTYKSGIHATISGVFLAMVIPSKGNINEIRFQTKISLLLEKFKLTSRKELKVLTSPEQQHIIHSMHKEIKDVDPLMHRLESKLHPIVTFLIMPLFALANAGVDLNPSHMTGSGIHPISYGIFFGLLIGKPLGIFLLSFLGIKMGVAAKPKGISWIQLAATGILGGIGFTMSIFIDNLAFTDHSIIDLGKVSILISSTTAAILGLIALSMVCKGRAPELTSEQILPSREPLKKTTPLSD